MLRWRLAFISLAVFILSVFICFSLLFGLWLPASNDLIRRQDAIEKRNNLEKVNAENEKFLALYTAAKEGVKQFDEGLLNGVSKTEAISTLTRLLEKCGLGIISESFSKVSHDTAYEVYVYELEIKGYYKGFRLLLLGLKDLPVRFYLYGLQLTGDEDGRVSGQVRLKVFRKSEGIGINDY